MPFELLGAVSLARIEHEQRSPPIMGSMFNCMHERSPTLTLMNQSLLSPKQPIDHKAG